MNKAFNYKSSRTYGIHYSTPIYSKPSQSTNQTFIICPNRPPNEQQQYNEDGQYADSPDVAQAQYNEQPQPNNFAAPRLAPRKSMSSTSSFMSDDDVHAAIAIVLSNYTRRTSNNSYDRDDRLILTADDFCSIISTLAVVNPWEVILSLSDIQPIGDVECGCCGIIGNKDTSIITGMISKNINGIQITKNNFKPVSYDVLQLLSRIYNFSIINVLVNDGNVMNEDEE